MSRANLYIGPGETPESARSKFIQKIGTLPITTEDKVALSQTFDSEVLPMVARMGDLIRNGSNMHAERHLRYEGGKLSIEVTTTKKNWLSKVYELFRGR